VALNGSSFSFRYLFAVTRPRFWLYLAGPYLLGYAAASETPDRMLRTEFWLYLLFFLFPANLLLYGANDLGDSDTDALNPKKGTKEARMDGRAKPLAWAVALSLLIGVVAAVSLATWAARSTMALFLFLSLGYSLTPLRFKARPFLDMASNVLYALPGFVGYLQAGGQGFNPLVLSFAWCWTASMHLFSAIPDVESDRRAGVATAATVLGERRSLGLCSFLWAAAAASLIVGRLLWPWCLATLAYPAVTLLLLRNSGAGVERAYWVFPALNGLFGMAAFFLIALKL